MEHDLVARARDKRNQQPFNESGKRAPLNMATSRSSVLKKASYIVLACRVLLSFH